MQVVGFAIEPWESLGWVWLAFVTWGGWGATKIHRKGMGLTETVCVMKEEHACKGFVAGLGL